MRPNLSHERVRDSANVVLMTALESAVARILPAALVHPDEAFEALGHVVGLLALRSDDPAAALRTTMHTAVDVVRPAEAQSANSLLDNSNVVAMSGWRP